MNTIFRINQRITSRLLILVVFSLTVLGIAAQEQPEEWRAPARKAKVKNPIPANNESIDAGREVFIAACVACHGESGRGDGPAAAALKPSPGDLTKSSQMKAQSDGELFWKISTGRTPMPAFKDAVSDEQLWQVVNFIRTLASETEGSESKTTK